VFADSIVNFVGYPYPCFFEKFGDSSCFSSEIGELGPGVFGVVRVVFLSGFAKLLNDG